MLSKSQARLFFISGTIFFSGVFLFLTVDTVLQVPEQTNQENITPAVLEGKKIWEDNNCMGCHTLLGEGAYYAPELTKAYPRRGEEWLRVFLKDPQAMYPGERKMVQYDFSEEDITNVIAFLKWISEMDLNGFPPEPTITVQAGTAVAHSADQPSKYSALCAACHAVGNQGGNVGPALDTVGRKFDRAYLERWISDPQSVIPGTAMPQLPLSDAELKEVVDYLTTLR